MEAINPYDVDGVAQDDVMAAYRKRKQKAMKAAKPGRPRNSVPEIG